LIVRGILWIITIIVSLQHNYSELYNAMIAMHYRTVYELVNIEVSLVHKCHMEISRKICDLEMIGVVGGHNTSDQRSYPLVH